jgi:hypothetical protein
MEAFVNAAEVLQVWSMIISRHTHAEEAAMFQIFSYFVNDAIEASRIVAHAKSITGQ